MTFILPALYHWTDKERRLKIQQKGLQVYKKPTVTSGNLRWPYICLGFTPSGAWGLSGDFINDMRRNIADPIEEWDLWQVRVPDGAELHVRSEFGDRLQEVKVFTTIPPDCIWLVGTREVPYAIEGKTG